ncbi:myb/SANT-like DNA-binding domain-containing protein 3 [Mytilus edulis]|uniref:myb/SANT-like DNA-binding domain-containing protein 3 n=1 Tax=Mytilus edulis TaxID=6550 RepID=UPI0039F02E5F
MDAEKKKRRSNWDSSEISLLRQLVEKNLFTIRSKFSNSLTNKSKVEVWRGITVQINALGLHGRTVAEVKVKWQNMQSNAKKTYQNVKKHTHQTGGGPPATPINQESQKIIEMMKDTSSFVGLTGEESPVGEEKKIKPEDVVVKQHEVLCKQSEYYDLKNQKLKIEIAILRSQMDKHELASLVCDLFGLEL